jgi:natural product precursor
MKTINLKGISNPLSEREMKDVKGGAQPGSGGFDQFMLPNDDDAGYGIQSCGDEGKQYCKNKKAGEWCVTDSGRTGVCKGWPAIPPCLICWLG